MQVLRDLVSTHRNLCFDTVDALEVSVLTQVQNKTKMICRWIYALEVSVITQVQNLLIYDVLGIIALEVSVLAQVQNNIMSFEFGSRC